MNNAARLLPEQRRWISRPAALWWRASRGTIYRPQRQRLAVSATAETVFLFFPRNWRKGSWKSLRPRSTEESLSAGLSQLLGVTQESILEQMERAYSRCEVATLRVDEDTANADPGVPQ